MGGGGVLSPRRVIPATGIPLPMLSWNENPNGDQINMGLFYISPFVYIWYVDAHLVLRQFQLVQNVALFFYNLVCACCRPYNYIRSNCYHRKGNREGLPVDI